MGRFSQIVPLALLFVLFMGSILTVVEGKPRPDSIFGSSHSVIPGMDEFKTNFNLNKIGDVIQGKRDMSVVVGRNGIELNAGMTDEEKLVYGSIGIAALLLLVCCCVCCCRMCCGGQKPTTNVVYQQLSTPQYHPSRSDNPAPTHSVPISTVSSDATKWM